MPTFTKNDNNYFCILLVAYDVEEDHIVYHSCHFKPIEAFAWDCLTIGALGWGQIQIANANSLLFEENPSRKEWMLKLCDNLQLFYDEEIGKVGERKSVFQNIRSYWENK